MIFPTWKQVSADHWPYGTTSECFSDYEPTCNVNQFNNVVHNAVQDSRCSDKFGSGDYIGWEMTKVPYNQNCSSVVSEAFSCKILAPSLSSTHVIAGIAFWPDS